MMTQPAPWQQWKRQLRAQALANRWRQENKDRLSREICDRLAALPEYFRAGTVLFYLGMLEEVHTQHLLPTAWQQGKQVVIPYCVADELELFRLRSFEELAPDTWGILEPRPELRSRADRRAEARELDALAIPGLAFDRRGGRIGHGKGYFDRLLRGARPDAARIALAFQCQVFDEVPMLPHDVYMDIIVTEAAVYRR